MTNLESSDLTERDKEDEADDATEKINGDDDVNDSDGKVVVTPMLIYKTICLYMTFLALGWAHIPLGATLVNLEMLYNSDTKTIALSMSLHGLGYLLGSFLCGAIYDKLNAELQFAVSCLIMGLSTLSPPWIPYLSIFIVLMTIQGVTMGFIDSAGQSYCVNMWKGHRLQDPILQAVHAIWSIGSTTGPLIIKPFLVEINTDRGNVTLNETYSDFNGTSNGSAVNSDQIPHDEVDVGRIRYAYLLIGLLITLVSLFYIAAYVIGGVSCLKTKGVVQESSEQANVDKKKDKYFKIALLIMVFFFYYLYLHVEGIPGSFWASFVVKQLGWKVETSSLLLTAFWGAIGVGRTLGVAISICLSPKQMIILNLIVTSLGFLLTCFVVHLPQYVVFISAITSGLGMASTFASGVLWTASHMKLTGRAASVFLIGSSTGGMTSLFYTAYMFETISYMVVVYIPFAASLAMIVLFIIMEAFTSWYEKNHVIKPNLVKDEVELQYLNQQDQNAFT